MQHPSIFGYLARQLEDRPDSEAYVYRGGKMTFRELHETTSKLSGALKARGVQPGDRVATVMQDSIELVLAILSAMGMGAIAVPINPLLSGADICHVVNDSSAKTLFVSEAYLETALNLKPQLRSLEAIVTTGPGRPGVSTFAEFLQSGDAEILLNRDGPAFILYTSGSTGRPKGALITIPTSAASSSRLDGRYTRFNHPIGCFSASRTPFAYGFGNTIGFTIGFGAAMILLSDRPTPESIAKIFAEFDPTIFFAIPAVFRNILQVKVCGGRFSPPAAENFSEAVVNAPP